MRTPIATKLKLGTIPYATIALAVASFVIYYRYGTWCSYYRCYFTFTGNWILHPILHTNELHLFGNVVLGVMILGPLIEVWMKQLNLKGRYFLMFIGYPIGLVIGYIEWHSSGAPGIGSSGLESIWLAFCIAYYWRFHKISQVRRALDAFAPVGLGFSIAFFVAPFILGDAWGYIERGEPPAIHLYFFIIGAAIACVLFRWNIFRANKEHDPARTPPYLVPVNWG